MKAAKPDGIANQPASTRPQIHILAADYAYIFDAIPGIIVGHADRYDRLRNGYAYGGGHV
jgi:hypothetical protein